MADIDFGVTKIADHPDKGEGMIVEQFRSQYGGELAPPPEPPVRSPAAWWKGEDNYVDSVQPGLVLSRANTALDPAFADGEGGRCFIVDSQGGWDSLTIGGEGVTQAKTNLSSFETWELELYVEFDSLNGWFYLFEAYDYAGGDDYVASSIELEDDYIDVYNQGVPWVKFENIGLQAGTRYKINLVYTKATNKWKCFVNDIEKTPSDIDEVPATDHDYTTFFVGEDWNSPVLHVENIKIFTGTPVS